MTILEENLVDCKRLITKYIIYNILYILIHNQMLDFRLKSPANDYKKSIVSSHQYIEVFFVREMIVRNS
jgi:hypothetical protein